MRQLLQNFRSGELSLEEVPEPMLTEGSVLVENAYSVISPGTERSTIELGRAGILGKAKRRPELARQVMQNLKKEGLIATLKKVQSKLDAPKALGYSCAGVVLESKDFDSSFRPGDRVACAGQDYASHADRVCVPRSLVVKVPDSVTLQEAAFTTLGAIALQAVRQAAPQIGESVCVIGLGLIGQLTCQILRANGCRVFGIDTSAEAAQMAIRCGTDAALARHDKSLYQAADDFTAGYGFDKVILTSSSPDNDPVIVATELSKKRGLIVVVGNVKMDIPREPHFYKKELGLVISTSYGPGRYDPLYEEAGIDYPYAYVRFTENRNLEAFLQLVSAGKVNLTPLITHEFDFSDALEAYRVILNKEGGYSCAVLLRYGEKRPAAAPSVTLKTRTCQKDIVVGMIGAGSFAQGYLLPALKKLDVSLDTIVAVHGASARNAGRKFGFRSASTSVDDILKNGSINTVVIATQHDSHAGYICRALCAGKHVFCEKPLSITEEQLKDVVSASRTDKCLLVGFNRRFAPLSTLLKKELKGAGLAKVISYRVNAGLLPQEHWALDPGRGGGRIIGEACHFIDLMAYLTDSLPVRVYASSLRLGNAKWREDDNLQISIEFADGSLGSIIYTAMGDKAMGKERLEVFCAGNAYVINDFKTAEFFTNGRKSLVHKPGKGHAQELESFIRCIRQGGAAPISLEEMASVTLATFKAMESLRKKTPQEVGLSGLTAGEGA